MFVLRRIVFGLFLVSSFQLCAEEAQTHGNQAPGAGAPAAGATDSTTRPPADAGTLSNAIKALTSQVFPLSQGYVENRYKTKLPEALAAAKNENEEPIGTIVGWLFGRLPTEEDVVSLVDVVLAEKAEEEKKPETERNLELIEYQKRLLWGAKALRGEEIAKLKDVNPPSGPYEKFKTAFLASYDKQAEASKTFADLMKRAKTATTKEEREAIRKELNDKFEDTGAYFGWNAMRGREEISGALANTLATLNQSTGNHYIDMMAPTGANFRLVLGSDPSQFGSDVVKMVKGQEKLAKIGNWQVSPRPIEVPPENTFALNDRKIEKWRADVPPETIVADTTTNQPAGGGGDDAGGATSNTVSWETTLNTRCNGCHVSEGMGAKSTAVLANRVLGGKSSSNPGMNAALAALRRDAQLITSLNDWKARQ